MRCLCGYETLRSDNFLRHLKRKTSWCDEVKVITNNKISYEEQIIKFYYDMINTKKDFVI